MVHSFTVVGGGEMSRHAFIPERGGRRLSSLDCVEEKKVEKKKRRARRLMRPAIGKKKEGRQLFSFYSLGKKGRPEG